MCPQCGAPVRPPREEAVFRCPWCRSSLAAQGGVPVHLLVDRVAVDISSAREVVRAWLSGPDFPAAAARHADPCVGELSYVLFLRIRRAQEDVVGPVGEVPQPELADLARVPADLVPVQEEDVLTPWLSTGSLQALLGEAARQPGVTDLALELRGFYPVSYRFKGSRFTAAVPAAGGPVLAWRRPARGTVIGEGVIVATVAGILFGEAFLVPGLVLRIGLIGLSAFLLFFLVDFLVRRYA